MTRTTLLAACLAVIPGLAAAPLPAQDALPALRLLFLGDRGHHRPAVRSAILTAALAGEGIAVTYSDDPADLEASRLAGFDALLLYANLDAVAPEREQALLDFVEGGKGFVPVHCASACLGGSDRFIALVGARFRSHGTGVFRAEIADRDHPVMRGQMSFESWDETYVHDRHAEDRTVLAYRVEREHREPWTWARSQGKGRVFYTASGHDERTWNEPGFQAVLARGIRWAAGDRFLGPFRPLPRREYEEAEVPTYARDGERRAADGKPRGRIQKPLSPEDSMALAAVPAGFELRLFAAEPDIGNPIAMAFDERGRLWIAESVDYPNERKPEGEGRDRIRVLEDTDGDGRADRFTLFADKLSIPTALAFCRGGVVVLQAPDTLWLADTDGDGRADVRKKVSVPCWGTGDTHAGPSHLRYGFDNCFWGCVGYAGMEWDGHHGQGIFQIVVHPQNPMLADFKGNTSNNTWGFALSETDEVFYSTANNDVINHLALPNGLFERVHGWNARGTGFIGAYREMHPATDDVRQVDWHGRFTAASGCALYTAREFPERYWNRVAFICEPTGHLVHQSVLEPDGSGFVARDGFNLFESRDAWTAPVYAEVGPDGAVWMVDWYSPVVQHNPTPHGFKTGPGNAYETPLRDTERARIYRIVPRGKALPPPLDLAKAAPEALVTTLRNPNLLWRQHAQRLLVERGKDDIVPALLAMLDDRSVDAGGGNPGVLHALWTLSGVLDPVGERPAGTSAAGAALTLLRHPAPAVRGAALRVLCESDGAGEAVLAGDLLGDAGPIVRREALVTLAWRGPCEGAGRAILAALGRPENAADRWIPLAATAAAANHAVEFLAAALAEGPAEAHPAAPAEPEVNLLPNPSFETAADGARSPAPPWRVRTYAGRAEHRLAAGGRTGERCLEISSESGSDTSWFADVEVEPETAYRLSGWIRTEDLAPRGGALGAMLNVHGRSPDEGATTRVRGTAGWKRVDLEFTTAREERRVSINCLFGGWGRATGTAWFDDVSLVRVGGTGAAERGARAVEAAVRVVARHAAATAKPRERLAILAALAAASGPRRAIVLAAFAAGWPEEQRLKLPDEERDRLALLLPRLDPGERQDLLLLDDRLGNPPFLAAQRESLGRELFAALADAGAPDADRVDAARRLLRHADDEASRGAILAELDPKAAPELLQGLVEALAASRAPVTGAELASRWESLTPAARKSAVAILLRRTPWTVSLLEAVRERRIPRGDLAADQWERLFQHADTATAVLAVSIGSDARALPDLDRQAVIDRLLPHAERAGDADRGEQVFITLCSSCHRVGERGAALAPALDGVGLRARRDILVDVVDPNRSYESTYQLWNAYTKENEAFSGRLVNETRTTVELLDSGDVRHVLARASLDLLRPEGRSAMPVGLLDAMPPDDVAALFEFLSRQRQAK